MRIKQNTYRPFYIKAVLFDFDGTLTKPGALDFQLLKKTINCPADTPVLEFIESLPTRSHKDDASAVLARFEKEAAAISIPNPGAQDLIHYLRSKSLAVGIITRNTLSSIKRFKDIDLSTFDVVISRETPVRVKPSGDGITLAAGMLNIDVRQMIMVGDYIFDIHAGQKAGCITVFIDYHPTSGAEKIDSDFIVTGFEEIKDIIFVNPDTFDPAHTIEIATEIGDVNKEMTLHNRKYLLIGPGRWGSADRWLGIPVRWTHISAVGAIVETAFESLKADPSQGSHFFHNITSLGISYLNTAETGEDFINWQWLQSLPAKKETPHLKHITLNKPLTIKIDGKQSKAVIIASSQI